MSRNKNELPKKTSKLTKLLILLIFIILGLISYIVTTRLLQSDTSTQSNNSIQVVNTSSYLENSIGFSSSESNTAVSETFSSSNKQAVYAVTFPKGTVLMGENEQLRFAVTTYTNHDDLAISYSPKGFYAPDAHMSEVASLVPTTIPTTTIQVVESGVTKDVKMNTELKLQNSGGNQASSDFFTPFNGNDTKVYAYLNNNGNIVLAFTPTEHNGPYTTIVLEE